MYNHKTNRNMTLYYEKILTDSHCKTFIVILKKN